MYVVQQYTFTPGPSFEGTIEIPAVLKLEDIESITNATRGSVLYKPDEGAAGATISVSGGSTTLTLEQNTSYCQSTDEIQIVVIGEGGGGGPSANVVVTNTASDPVPVVDAKIDNSWIPLRTWVSPTTPLAYNTRPSSGQFQTVTGLTSSTMQLEVIAKLTTSPAASYRLYVWVDDGTEVYCVSPAGGNAGENGSSANDPFGPFDAVAPVIIDLRRYTPSIKIAALVCLDQSAVVFDVNNNCANPGFVGGENVLLSTSAILPAPLSGPITGINAAADTVTWSGPTFANGEILRLNLTQIGTNHVPYLGFSARGRAVDIDLTNDWFVLESGAIGTFVVGDNVRLRAASGISVLPSVSGSALSATTTYTITEISGNSVKLSLDGVTPLNITAPGVGLYYIFKFPYIYCYAKGGNQFSYSQGGAAIDFIAQHTNAPITVNPGQACLVNPVTGAWTVRNNSSTFFDNSWTSVTWAASLNLFVAVSNTGTSNRVMTSPDGINWTTRTSAADNSWNSVAWSPSLGLFVAVAITGTNRVMTSPDGVTWTIRASANDSLTWNSVTWSPALGLFVAVSTSGTGNRVMTSTNGTAWTIRSSAADNTWTSVTWAASLNLFVAVATTGIGNRVMTSPDGTNWTARASAADNGWNSVVWSPALNLFVAVASSGTGNRVMTSPDGINWTARVSAADNAWSSVEWSPSLGLFVAVSTTGSGNRVMTSPDGINWAARTTPVDNAFNSVVWAPSLNRFVSVAGSGTSNRVMTSDASDYVAHGFSQGKELRMTATTTIPGGAFQNQRFYVKNPSTYSYSLSLTPGGPAVAFTSTGAGVQMIDPATGAIVSAAVNAGTPASITLMSHWLGTLNSFTLGGSVLPGDYTNQAMWTISSPAITATTFSFSENKLTPCVFASAGSGVTLSAGGTDWAQIAVEKLQAWVATSPAPTDTTLSLSLTPGGPAVAMTGGTGAQSIVDAANLSIKAGSYIKARAM